MKLRILIVGIACFLITNAIAQTGYVIKGNIKNLPDGITFYLIQGADTTLRVKSKNQKFQFKGTLKDEGELVFIKMDTSIVKPIRQKNTWVRLLLDNSIVQLVGDLKQWPEIDVIGSKPTEEFDKFSNIINTPRNEASRMVNETNDPVKKCLIYEEYNLVYKKALDSIPNSYAIPLFIINNGAFEISALEAEYDNLSNRLKSSFYGKKLQQLVSSIKMRENIGIGKVIPDFKIKTPEGEIKSVKDLAMKSRYTLIDFWAYWCKPCRADIPNMKKVYNTFQIKNFNIISVSTDPNEVQWKKALREENTPWINGMQQGNVSSEIFGLISIPAYILLNNKSEIILMDMNTKFSSKALGLMNGAEVFMKDFKTKRLRGEDLQNVLEDLLGK